MALMRNILLDTNAYTAFTRGEPEAVEILQHTPVIGLNVVILGELLGGFAHGSREALNRERLRLFMASDRVKLFPINRDTAEFYATSYRDLRRRGKPIPTNDLWIAATAQQYGLAVFTYDPHFSYVEGLLIGSRLPDFL